MNVFSYGGKLINLPHKHKHKHKYMSTLFSNLMNHITEGINIPLLVNIRRAKMEEEGFDTGYINWDHYTKVLEAKASLLRNS